MSERDHPKNSVSLADITEHRKAPVLNLVLSVEEKEKILLPSPINEGFAGIDTILQPGISVIVRPDGALECIDCVFNRAISRDGGRTWSEYDVVGDLAEKHAKALAEECSFHIVEGFGWLRFPSGKIGLGWNETGRNSEGHRYNRLWWRTSSDQGKTWSEDVPINPTGELGLPYLGEPMRITSSGRLVLPVRACFADAAPIHPTQRYGMGWWNGEKVNIEGHGHHPELDLSYVYYSDDEGQTWYRSPGEIFGWLYGGWGNCVSCDEPGVDELKDGRLMMLARSTCGRLLQSFSEDDGKRWSIVEPSPLASSYSPCALRKIPQTGDLMCVWNQISADEARLGKTRGRLSAAISSDGKIWKHFRTLERHGRMDEADRIEPDEMLLMCRSLDDVGDLPADRGTSDYPAVAFHGDDVIINYAHVKGAQTLSGEHVSAMKIRVVPLEWFYSAP